MQNRSQQSSSGNGPRSSNKDFARRFVFPYDAKDIKAHKWFKGVPWERLHELDPPFVPMIRSADDTQYFDEEEAITDVSESDDGDDDQALPDPEAPTPVTNLNSATSRDGAHYNVGAVPSAGIPDSPAVSTVNHIQLPTPPSTPTRDEAHANTTSRVPVAGAGTTTPTTTVKKRAEREVQLAEALEPFDRGMQNAMYSWLAVPFDTVRLRHFQLQVDYESGLRTSEREALKNIVRIFGRKEKKRPRDRLLRDPTTKRAVLEERKKTAFLGYDWTRIRASPATVTGMLTAVNGAPAPPGLVVSAATGNGLVTGGLSGGA